MEEPENWRNCGASVKEGKEAANPLEGLHITPGIRNVETREEGIIFRENLSLSFLS